VRQRRCRHCTQRPEEDIEDGTRLHALWTVLTTNPAVAAEPELVDKQLLDWWPPPDAPHRLARPAFPVRLGRRLTPTSNPPPPVR
jgi:hypothetical protein